MIFRMEGKFSFSFRLTAKTFRYAKLPKYDLKKILKKSHILGDIQQTNKKLFLWTFKLKQNPKCSKKLKILFKYNALCHDES